MGLPMKKYFLVFSILFAFPPSLAAGETLQAGAAKTEIHIPAGVSLEGYGKRHGKLSQGTDATLSAVLGGQCKR